MKPYKGSHCQVGMWLEQPVHTYNPCQRLTGPTSPSVFSRLVGLLLWAKDLPEEDLLYLGNQTFLPGGKSGAVTDPQRGKEGTQPPRQQVPRTCDKKNFAPKGLKARREGWSQEVQPTGMPSRRNFKDRDSLGPSHCLGGPYADSVAM